MKHFGSDPLEIVVPQIWDLYYSKVSLQPGSQNHPHVTGEGGEEKQVFNCTPIIAPLKIVEPFAVHQLPQVLRELNTHVQASRVTML